MSEYNVYYWPIRGLGSLVRATLLVQELPFKDNRITDWYDENGTQSKQVAENALINLPSLRTPSGEFITQTFAIVNHIARQPGPLKPRSDVDAARVDQVVEHLRDLQAEKMKMSYGARAPENKEGFFAESTPYYYGTLESFVAKNKTTFVAAEYVTFADIFLAEQFAGLEKLQKGLEWAEKFPKLVAIYKAVLAHPKLAAYYEAEKDVPHNSPAYACWH